MNQHPHPVHDHIVELAREAIARGPEGLAPGDVIAAAFALNRPEWLPAAGVTLAEAVDRLGPTWLSHIPVAARVLAREVGGGQGLEGRVSRAFDAAARRYEVDPEPGCPYGRLRFRCWTGADLEVQGQFPSDRGEEAHGLGQEWVGGKSPDAIGSLLP